MILDIIPSLPAPMITFSRFKSNFLDNLVRNLYPEESGYRCTEDNALSAESIALAFWTGLVFGIVAYGTYNLTNMATIKNWSSTVVFVDLIWGGLLTGITSGLVVYIMKNLISTN